MKRSLAFVVSGSLLCACGLDYDRNNPYDTANAALDFDGDGVPNGEDGDPRDRTCGRTDDDANNCGACGNVCGVDHKGDTCEAGSCGCAPGWSDPDGDPANGCECLNQSEGPGGEVCCEGPGGEVCCEAANGDTCCENAQGYQECEPSGGRGGPYVLVPAATFWMGCRNDLNGSWTCYDNEEPQHEVRLSAYGIDVHEVTQSEYRAFVDDTGHRTPSCDWDPYGTPDHPVVCVSWDDLRAYCQWAGGDLPTEAQWEYAARGPMAGADDYAAFPWGTNEIDCEHAVIDEGGDGCGTGGAWPVCSKRAGDSPFGLCDLAGNVWEWCLDRYDGDYYDSSPLQDPEGPTNGSSRALRGGSWSVNGDYARAANRYNGDPANRNGSYGGRCARPGQL